MKTWIWKQAVVSGVTGDRNQAKITVVGVPDRPGIAANLFGVVAEHAIVVDMIIQNVSHQDALTDISFTVPRSDLARAMALVKQTAAEINAGAVEVTGGNCQGLAGGSRHAVPFGSGVTNVPHAGTRKNQHHDDQHVRNQDFLCPG